MINHMLYDGFVWVVAATTITAAASAATTTDYRCCYWSHLMENILFCANICHLAPNLEL